MLVLDVNEGPVDFNQLGGGSAVCEVSRRPRPATSYAVTQAELREFLDARIAARRRDALRPNLRARLTIDPTDVEPGPLTVDLNSSLQRRVTLKIIQSILIAEVGITKAEKILSQIPEVEQLSIHIHDADA